MVAHHTQFDPEIYQLAEDGVAMYANSIVEQLHDSQARLLVAEIGGEIVGYVSGSIADITTETFLPLHCGILADIFVREEYRRSGIGRQLVQRLMLWFRSRGIQHFEWQVNAKNQAALAFWSAMGGETTFLRMRAEIQRDEK